MVFTRNDGDFHGRTVSFREGIKVISMVKKTNFSIIKVIPRWDQSRLNRRMRPYGWPDLHKKDFEVASWAICKVPTVKYIVGRIKWIKGDTCHFFL